MKKTGLVLLVLLGGLIPAAHAHRWHGLPEALAWLAPLAFLFSRREFVRRSCQALFLAGAWVTLDTMVLFIRMRQGMDIPWARLAVILSLAALIPLAAAWALQHPFFRRPSASLCPNASANTPDAKPTRDSKGTKSLWPPEASYSPPLPSLTPPIPWPALSSIILTFLALAAVQAKPGLPMLLAERFRPGAGWLEASLLAMYAGFVAEALLTPGRGALARRRIWGLFSLAFFAQLALGLAGLERFLMSGSLHLPVPALIAAGPLFRGEGVFMLLLFGATVLLAGSAWCSHLCYIGAWDQTMADRRPAALLPAPAWMRPARMVLAGLVFAAAWGMGRAGVPGATAAWLAAGFGLAGVGLMVATSRRLGVMAHCAGWCPMGLVAGILGRLSPWRLSIGEGCTACGACSRVCRYDALRPGDLAARRPGVSCSLCGDCLSSCPRSELALTAFGRRGTWVRPAFVSLAAALHAVFLGVARL